MTRPVGSPAACRQARGAVQGIVASRADLLGFRRMKPLPDACAVQGVEKGRWLVAPVERPPGQMFDRREPCAGDVAGVRGERHRATDAGMPLRPCGGPSENARMTAGLDLAIERGWLAMHESGNVRQVHAGGRRSVRLGEAWNHRFLGCVS